MKRLFKIANDYIKSLPFFLALILIPSGSWAQDPNHPGILEPVLSAVTGTEVRIPHTDQADGNTLLTVAGTFD